MAWVIRCFGIASGDCLVGLNGALLETYDPEAADGIGTTGWTRDPAKARRFDTYRDAFQCWQAIPRCRPVRADGKPNRPLTAFSVSIEEIGP